ncbi:MFS transporter [Aquabacterium fontiphilum]|jgi:PAT family beta-lactamase induction signal transducer AmpG|uniref:AmpG family muropeptide MFS transporter n=1 Tax=Aquabacterium fontiphilum TaxID=450365 RepID=UPI0013790F05|nr:AmpG family muropeptide MFS transporter [Aquabacterium fontiphilum]NBD19323.1 MFS transporter [Aquabacterium fontiphilum]
MSSSLPGAPQRPAPHRRLLFWVALLYFSEGLPLGLFYDLFPVHMRQTGVSPADIGLLSLLGLAWTVKFLWAPVVEAWRGHKVWMAGANVGMAVVLATLATRPEALALGHTWPWVLLAAFTVLSATNDIATDGYTIEALTKEQYGVANGIRIGFYRVGMLAAGGTLIAASWLGSSGAPNWTAAYLLAAATMVFNASCILAAPALPWRPPAAEHGGVGREWALLRARPVWLLALGLFISGLLWPVLGPVARAADWSALTQVSATWWFKGAVPVGLMMAGAGLMVVAARQPGSRVMEDGPVFGALVELLARPGMLAVLAFILLFKLGDAAMGFMVKPFWVDAGFSPAAIGLVSVNVGLGLSIAGGLAGGWYVDRVGIFKGLWVLGLAQAASNLGYAAAAWYVQPTPAGMEVAAHFQAAVYAASALESFTGGLGTGAFLAFLMGITSRARATTEYAILSSIFAFSRAVAGWAGGLGVQEMGYATFFFLTFWLSFPAYALLPAVRRMLDRTLAR